MPEIILHQYVNSPFSEKIRKIFAHKKISWRSVEQPVIMPKPKLVPLTGGYRRIPVLQIGADVWSDTGIIIRKIDELAPEPTLYPGGLTAAADTMNQWADRRLFWSTTPVIFEKLAAVVPKEFIEDRSKMMQGANFGDIARSAPDSRNQLSAYLEILDRQLASRPFLLGDSFSLADAACFHPVWFLRAEPTAFGLAKKFPHLMRWFERIDAMGYGDVRPMDPDEALKIAKDSTPATRENVDCERSQRSQGRDQGIRDARRLRLRSGHRKSRRQHDSRDRNRTRRSRIGQNRESLPEDWLPNRLSLTAIARIL